MTISIDTMETQTRPLNRTMMTSYRAQGREGVSHSSWGDTVSWTSSIPVNKRRRSRLDQSAGRSRESQPRGQSLPASCCPTLEGFHQSRSSQTLLSPPHWETPAARADSLRPAVPQGHDDSNLSQGSGPQGEQTGPASEPAEARSRTCTGTCGEAEDVIPRFLRGRQRSSRGRVSLSGVTLEEEEGPRASTFGGADVFKPTLRRSPPAAGGPGPHLAPAVVGVLTRGAGCRGTQPLRPRLGLLQRASGTVSATALGLRCSTGLLSHGFTEAIAGEGHTHLHTPLLGQALLSRPRHELADLPVCRFCPQPKCCIL